MPKDNVTQERFDFKSAGEELVGNLFLPQGKPRGVVIATGPLTSVKEQAAGVYCRAMAERGFAALAFDYRNFGESSGQPRQLEDPRANIEDIANAVSALGADERLRGLPVFALGICFGAGPMAQAVAQDKRFRAFAGVAGVYTRKANPNDSGYQATLKRGQDAERIWRETGKAETIPAVAAEGGDVAMPLHEAYDYYGTPRGAVPNYVNGFAVQSYAHLAPFEAQSAASRLGVPTLVVHSEKALQPELAHAFYAELAVPKQELWLSSQGQIDFYDDPKLINAAADSIEKFFSSIAAA